MLDFRAITYPGSRTGDSEFGRIEDAGLKSFGKGMQEEIGMSGLPVTMTLPSNGLPGEPRARLRSLRAPIAGQSPLNPSARSPSLMQRTPTQARQHPMRRDREPSEVLGIIPVVFGGGQPCRGSSGQPEPLAAPGAAGRPRGSDVRLGPSELRPGPYFLSRRAKSPPRSSSIRRPASASRLAMGDHVRCQPNAAHALQSVLGIRWIDRSTPQIVAGRVRARAEDARAKQEEMAQ